MDRKRVLLIGSEPSRMTRLRRTYKSLRALGVDVRIFAPYEVPRGRPRALKGMIRYLLLSLQILLSKADIYHIYNIPDIIGLPLIFKRGKVVYDVRSPWFSTVLETLNIQLLSKIALFIEWVMTHVGDWVLTANTPLAVRAQRWKKRNVILVPNYPPSDFGPTIPRETTRDRLELDNNPTVLYLGKISILEGSELLKKIIQKTCSTIQQARFLIVGDGPRKQSLEQFVSDRNLSSHVIFCGWIDHSEVANYIAASDVCVFPRLWTSFSPYTSPENILKIGEYLRLNKPVIAPRMGGFTNAEFPIIPSEPEGMADALIEFLSNPTPVTENEWPSWEISHERLSRLYRHLGCID